VTSRLEIWRSCLRLIALILRVLLICVSNQSKEKRLGILVFLRFVVYHLVSLGLANVFFTALLLLLGARASCLLFGLLGVLHLLLGCLGVLRQLLQLFPLLKAHVQVLAERTRLVEGLDPKEEEEKFVKKES